MQFSLNVTSLRCKNLVTPAPEKSGETF
jgi:hypothetical protein